ncbi:glycoside hydrolase family 172 protein [Pedobacter sp. UBA4863]|uniref:glycoside hydrolase family 172 protein n=1 Tax=Pedobacter sp. UBA4863 TaxID=1947060 RepID=UPI0025D29EDA|nr:glycoside hydrolase family 172 protein [Pedobacter sp. UBA4863]
MINFKLQQSLVIVVFTIILGISINAKAQETKSEKITVSSLLDELISMEESALFPAIPYKTHQASSYDRAAVAPNQPNWFANNDGFGIIREEEIDGKKVRVLFDEEGPGVVTRVWVTTIANKRGVLRFYFDKETSPRLTINSYDFVKFGIEEYGAGLLNKHTSYLEGIDKRGGSTMYFPIPYAKSLKIVFEPSPDVPLRQKYFHFNIRKYANDVKVETFKPEDIKALAEKIKAVNKTLNNPQLPEGLNTLKKMASLPKGESVKLDLPAGENAVYELKINVKSKDKVQFAQLMRSLVLKASFDHKQTILVPVGDFSAGGFGAKEVKSWFLNTDGNGNITSRWIMPYQKSGTIAIENVADMTADIALEVKYKPRKWIDRSLYFYSAWKYERGIRLGKNAKEMNTTTAPFDWNFATIKGKGIYKGDVISLFNHTRAWYGEGDEKIWVDDDTFPSHFGTGLEDYYNSSWAPVIVFQTPFGGAPRADLPSAHGYNTFFRTRNLDGITFNNSFKFDMETLSWANGKADFATAIYFYGDAKTQVIGASGTAEAALPILPDAEEHLIKNAIEFEKVKPIKTSANLVAQKQAMNRYETGLWSDGAHLIVKNVQLNDSISFKFSGYQNTKHALQLHLTKSLDFGKLAFWINGKKAEIEFDGYATVPTNAAIHLGDFLPINGNFELTIKVVDTNPKSRGGKYLFGLDCIQIQKL